MDDYNHLGLNSKMQAISSPVANFQYTPAYDFESHYEVQSKRIRTSKVSIDNFVKRTGIVYATASFSDDSDMVIQTSARFSNPNRFKPFYGQPYWAIYEGTTKDAGHEIAPIKGTAVAGTYTVNEGFDYNAWTGSTDLIYRTQIIRNAGTSSQQFVYAIDIEYIDYITANAA